MLKQLFLFASCLFLALGNVPVGTTGVLILTADDFAHEADGYFAVYISATSEAPQPCSPCAITQSSACLPVSGIFEDGKTNITLRLDIPTTGQYAVSAKRCQRGLDSGNFTVSYTFRNPYGLLRGEEFYFYPYYACLSMVYFIFGMLWARQAFSNWTEIIPLQKWLAAVLVVGAIESVTWFLVYAIENSSGVPHTGAYVVAMLFSTAKRTLSYQVILSVCLGWGIVHKNLKEVTMLKLVILGGLYTIVYGVFAVMEELPVNISMFVIPVAFLDSVYFYWMYLGLSRTKAFLALKPQHAEKLHVYTQFFHVMIIVALLSLIVLIASAFTGPQSWEAEWLLQFPNTAFWDGVFTLLAVTVALYWAPRPGTSRYLPADEDADEDEPRKKAAAVETPVTAFVINDEDFENIQSKMH